MDISCYNIPWYARAFDRAIARAIPARARCQPAPRACAALRAKLLWPTELSLQKSVASLWASRAATKILGVVCAETKGNSGGKFGPLNIGRNFICSPQTIMPRCRNRQVEN